MTIGAVKFKLSNHCGTAPQDMSLTLKDEGGRQIASLGDDSRKLGYYSPQDGCGLAFSHSHLPTDTSTANSLGPFVDVSQPRHSAVFGAPVEQKTAFGFRVRQLPKCGVPMVLNVSPSGATFLQAEKRLSPLQVCDPHL